MAANNRAHIPLPANSLQGSSRHEKEFQKYTFATVWKDNIADKCVPPPGGLESVCLLPGARPRRRGTQASLRSRVPPHAACFDVHGPSKS